MRWTYLACARSVTSDEASTRTSQEATSLPGFGLLSGRAIPPVCLYADGNFQKIARSDRVEVLQGDIVYRFVPDQPGRRFHYLRVRVGDDSEPVSIVNCHVPASKKVKLTVDTRQLTFLAFHRACAGDRFIWGGDFNTGVIQATALVQSIDDSYNVNSTAAQP